jgi:hypothetical protein
MQRQRPQGSKRPAPPLTGNTSRLAPLTPGVPETLQCNVATGNPRPIPARRSAAAPLHVVVPRSTCNVQPATPRAASPRAASPRASRRPRDGPRCRSGRSAAAPLHVVVPRSTCNVQPATPRAASPRAAAPLRPATWSSHVQRATFNLQRLAPHPHAPQRPATWSSHVQRATFNILTPPATAGCESPRDRAPSPV